MVLLGTAAVPLSGLFFARKIAVGPAFYSYALMLVGIAPLLTTAAAPALRGERHSSLTSETHCALVSLSRF